MQMKTHYIVQLSIINATFTKIYRIGCDRTSGEPSKDDDPNTIAVILEEETDLGNIYRIFNIDGDMVGAVFPGVPVYLEYNIND